MKPIERDHRRQAATRRLRYLAAGAVVIAVALVVAMTVLRPQSDDSTETVRTAPAPASPSPSRPDASVVPPAGPLLLPRPRQTPDGVGLGYPHTREGAISAAAHFTEAVITLDPRRGEKVARQIAAPTYETAVEDERRSVLQLRSSLGLPPQGSLDGAYATLQAQAYQVRESEPDHVTVWVLGLASAAGPATSGGGRTLPQAAVVPLLWVDGDWRLEATTENVPADAVIQPGTQQARAKGWRRRLAID